MDWKQYYAAVVKERRKGKQKETSMSEAQNTKECGVCGIYTLVKHQKGHVCR